jgi:hypothetical protein
MQNPDDILFRAVFSDPEHAGPLVCQAVPRDLAALIDWSAFTAAPTEVVAGGVLPSGVNTDLLFAARLRSGEGLLVLLERRSKVERWAVVEVFGTVLNILARCHELDPAAEPPFVLAVVVHHGREPWDAPTRLQECYELDALPPEVRAAVEPLLPRFEFVLFDLARMSESELRRWGMGEGGTTCRSTLN